MRSYIFIVIPTEICFYFSSMVCCFDFGFTSTNCFGKNILTKEIMKILFLIKIKITETIFFISSGFPRNLILHSFCIIGLT